MTVDFVIGDVTPRVSQTPLTSDLLANMASARRKLAGSPTNMSEASIASSSAYSHGSREEQWKAQQGSGKRMGHKLRKACAQGNLAQARELIQSGAPLHAYDEALERHALHFAALGGHADVCRYLAECGANVDAADIASWTPLHLAAENGWAEVISVLAGSFGANIGTRTTNGSVALHFAAINGHLAASEVLIDLMLEGGIVQKGDEYSRAFDRLTNNYGETPLEVARARGHSEVVAMLEARGRARGQDTSTTALAAQSTKSSPGAPASPTAARRRQTRRRL